MSDPPCYRDIARRCHELLKSTTNPDVAAQLREWAVECDREAEGTRRRSQRDDLLGDDLLVQARRYRLKAEEYRVVAEQAREPAARLSYQNLARSYEAMAGGLEDLMLTNLVNTTARSRESTG